MKPYFLLFIIPLILMGCEATVETKEGATTLYQHEDCINTSYKETKYVFIEERWSEKNKTKYDYYEYQTTIKYRLDCKKIPMFDITTKGEKKTIDFRSFGCCKIMGTCIVCVSHLDGDCNNYPRSGQTLLKYCLENQELKKYERNSKDDFTEKDNTITQKTRELTPTLKKVAK